MNDINAATTYLRDHFPVKQVRMYTPPLDLVGQKQRYLLFLNHQDQSNVEKTANEMVTQGFQSARAIQVGKSWDIVVDCEDVSRKVQSAAAQSGAFAAESAEPRNVSKAAAQAASTRPQSQPLDFTSFEETFGKTGLRQTPIKDGVVYTEFTFRGKTNDEIDRIRKDMNTEGIPSTAEMVPDHGYIVTVKQTDLEAFVNKNPPKK